MRDHRRGWDVSAQVLQHLVEPDIDLVAEPAADRDPFSRARADLVHEAERDVPGLYQKRDAPRAHAAHADQVHPRVQVHHPRRVGADDAHAVRACRLPETRLQFRAVASGLAETHREHHDPSNASLPAGVDEVGRHLRARAQNGQIHAGRQRLDGRKQVVAQEAPAARIHRVDVTRIARPREPAQDLVTALGRIGAGPHDRDRSGLEDAPKGH